MVDEYNKKTLEFLMESTHSAYLIHFFIYSSPFSVFFTFLWDAIFLKCLKQVCFLTLLNLARLHLAP